MEDFLDDIKEQISLNIGIDFDGVIHRNSKGFYDGTIYDEPLPGTKEALASLSKKYNIIIYTCKARSDRPLIDGKTGPELIWEWLKKHDLDRYIIEITDRKPRVLFYIDDKVIRFFDWCQTLKKVEEFEEDRGNEDE